MCVSLPAALPSQPCWRSVVEAGIPVGSFANAVAARCGGKRQACVPAAGLPPESGRRPAAVQGACGSRGGAKHLGVRQPCCHFTQPALLAISR